MLRPLERCRRRYSVHSAGSVQFARTIQRRRTHRHIEHMVLKRPQSRHVVLPPPLPHRGTLLHHTLHIDSASSVVLPLSPPEHQTPAPRSGHFPKLIFTKPPQMSLSAPHCAVATGGLRLCVSATPRCSSEATNAGQLGLAACASAMRRSSWNMLREYGLRCDE